MGSLKKPPLSQITRAHFALNQNCSVKEICIMCGARIKTMCFKNTGVCCELCRKDRDGDHSKNHAIIEAPLGGERNG
jgi:hypothetical protein